MGDEHSIDYKVLDLVPAQICLLDQAGIIQFVNRSWVNFAKENSYCGSDFAGLNYLHICSAAAGVEAEAAGSFGRRLQALLRRTGDSCFSVIYPCHAPNAKRWFKGAAAALENGAIIIHTDITEEYTRLEAESQALSAAGVIHDLRSPLGAVIGFSELMLEMATDDTPAAALREYLTFVQQAGDRMLNLVNELLDYAQELHRNDDATDVLIDVARLLDEVATQSGPQARQNQVKITRNVQQIITFTGDEHAIWKMLANIVSNAVKYNRPQGEVKIFAETNSSGGVEICVQDDGLGMPSRQLVEMFRPFTRSKAAQHALPIEGTGIGLALVREIAHRHDAMIRVSSAEGVGTSITVVFPSWRTATR